MTVTLYFSELKFDILYGCQVEFDRFFIVAEHLSKVTFVKKNVAEINVNIFDSTL